MAGILRRFVNATGVGPLHSAFQRSMNSRANLGAYAKIDELRKLIKDVSPKADPGVMDRFFTGSKDRISNFFRGNTEASDATAKARSSAAAQRDNANDEINNLLKSIDERKKIIQDITARQPGELADMATGYTTAGLGAGGYALLSDEQKQLAKDYISNLM